MAIGFIYIVVQIKRIIELFFQLILMKHNYFIDGTKNMPCRERGYLRRMETASYRERAKLPNLPLVWTDKQESRRYLEKTFL